MIKITTLHVHHAFLYISLQSRNNYDVKWPNFRVFWGRERQGDKFYHLCLNSGAAPLFSSTINSLVLSNWVTKDNREMVWKDAESIFQRHFHGRRRCRIVRSLIFLDRDGYLHCRTMEEKYGLLFCRLRGEGLNLELPNFNLKFKKNSFIYSLTKLWNSLPSQVRLSSDANDFRSRLHECSFLERVL